MGKTAGQIARELDLTETAVREWMPALDRWEVTPSHSRESSLSPQER
jgi:hypothetical protein